MGSHFTWYFKCPVFLKVVILKRINFLYVYVVKRTSEFDVIYREATNLSGFRIMSEGWNDGRILRCLGCLLVSLLLYYVMVEQIVL